MIEPKTPADITIEDAKMLALAISVAKKAGDVIRSQAYAPKTIKTKSSIVDLVTQTDQQCEALILKEIKAVYPDHAFIGGDGVYTLTDTPTWIIDPIDGTNNFVHSLPFVCVSIGLIVDKVVRIGVVHAPILNETFHAVRGHGAFLNGEHKLHVSSVDRLDSAVVSSEFGYDRTDEGISLMLAKLRRVLQAKAQSVRMFGSCAMNLSYVAAGRVDIYYEGRNSKHGIKPWDVCAGWLIVTEAGGVVLDTSGGTFDMCSGHVLASANQTLSEQALVAFQTLSL